MTEDAATTAHLEGTLDAGGSAASSAAEGDVRARDDRPADGSSRDADDEAIRPDPQAAGSRLGVLLTAVCLSLASLFGTISTSGIWEPYELNVADLARRIAGTLLGAKQLVIEGATNTVPTAGELGRGELPFTSIALGLRLLGLSEWAGRLPMALWGAAGVIATYLLLSRLVDRPTGAFAAIVLSTTPLYFLQSRTILGDIVTMAALAVAFAGLAVALLDDRLRARARCASALLGVLGMVAGFGARGVLFGVAVPTLSIGAAWLLSRESRSADRLGAIFGSLFLVLAAIATFFGVRALLRAEDHEFVRLLGCTVDRRRGTQTHD